MALIKRIWWLDIVIMISSCCFELSLCTKMTFEIRRLPYQVDTIPNDFTIDDKGEWKKLPTCSQNNCNTFNAWPDHANSCRCTCRQDFSTFRMGATARNSSCIKNANLRLSEGCTIHFQDEGTAITRVLKAIDTSNAGKNTVVFPRGSWCITSGPALYLNYGVWKTPLEHIFSLSNSDLQWKKSTKYSGRIVKQPLTCTNMTSKTSRHCIIFKISGKLSYDLNRPPTKVPTTKKPTTKKHTTKRPTTKRVTTKKTTTKLLTSFTTTYQTTPKLTTEQSTSGHTTHTLHTTHNTVEASTIPVTGQTTTERHKQSTNEIATTATEKIPTEASEMPATEQSTNETDVVPGKKGARGASSDSDNGDNTIMIAAIGASAAIACVIIICVFLWFVVKRKQNNRNNEAYSTDMTVITNGTGMNNNVSAPTLKNPIYDNTTYCQPTEKNHPKQLPKLGNPVYDKAIVNNNKSHQNNKKPSHKPKPKYDSNHYDNKDDDEAYDNPGYQDLIVKQGKNAVNNDSTYDNTYAEPEKPVYEALSTNSGRDSIYQPLVHNNQSTETVDTPEYLALVHENTRPEEQEIPEYLTLVDDDESNQTQSESPEYDYTYAHTPEKRTTLKAPNTRGAGMSQQDPHVYGTLQGPNHQGPPIYGVLQNPNDQGPPVYDVLEDPNDQGPPVYDVLEDPNNQGPPVYDVLEDPNDIGPPVYDVLEGPDSGDDYLMPVDGQ